MHIHDVRISEFDGIISCIDAIFMFHDILISASIIAIRTTRTIREQPRSRNVIKSMTFVK